MTRDQFAALFPDKLLAEMWMAAQVGPDEMREHMLLQVWPQLEAIWLGDETALPVVGTVQ